MALGAVNSAYLPRILASWIPSTQLPVVRSSSLTANIVTRSTPLLFPLWPSPSFQVKIPSILAGLWEGVLKAVPKKKTSHRKKRQRFLAGKALKDVTALNKCPGCGKVKRAHLLCPYCVREIRDFWLGKGNLKDIKASTKDATAK